MDLVRDVQGAASRIPVAVKLGPFFSALANIAQRPRPGRAPTAWCSSTASTSRTSTWRASRWCPSLHLSARSHELLLRLHWVAILYGHVRADLAVTGGVHTGRGRR